MEKTALWGIFYNIRGGVLKAVKKDRGGVRTAEDIVDWHIQIGKQHENLQKLSGKACFSGKMLYNRKG